MAAVPVDQLSAEQKDELVCTYAALILHDDGAEISADSMNKLIKASGNSVEAYWPMLYSKMLTGKNVGDLLSVGGGGGGSGGGAGGDAGAAAGGDAGAAGGGAKKEEAAEEEEEEMDFDLFG